MTTNPAQVNNWPKFVLLLVALVGLLVAWMIGVTEWDDIEIIVTGIVFYAAGNVGTAVEQPQQPIFSPKRRAADG